MRDPDLLALKLSEVDVPLSSNKLQHEVDPIDDVNQKQGMCSSSE